MKTEINVWAAFAVLAIHWFADFVLQTDWQAKNKSKNNGALTIHVLVYTAVFLIASDAFAIISNNNLMFLFAPITFICHWITDYFTSRLNSKLWATNKVHLFFVSIGFDQLLHYAQLLITFQILNK